MNILGIEFFWGTDFLPEGKKFEPVGMVQNLPDSDFKIDYLQSEMADCYKRLAQQVEEMNCNVVILQEVRNIRAGDSVYMHLLVVGHAGVLKDKDE
mgnify:CR=1 FL=1